MYLKDMFRIRTIFFPLILIVHHSFTSKYHCGPNNNAFYLFISQLLTIPCEQYRINSCCLKHDQCYDDCSVTQLVCDTFFCDCLKDIQTNFYCRESLTLEDEEESACAISFWMNILASFPSISSSTRDLGAFWREDASY
ncbi:unnamed protein product [Cercopithifilaria johnstoni]|uniref:Uncharacterized protein n=1 Tax=Cercopithifilaria johnstoni TaxID=2874296 RepID=A0A8J2Q366_9BILA|nr:unnamed protein product [Cercopithifilaria johnstoni]